MKPTLDEIFRMLRKEFHKELEAQTNWGRRQLKIAFERAVQRVLFRIIEAGEEAQL